MPSSSEMSTEVGRTELTPRTEQWEVATTAEREEEEEGEMVTVVSLRQSESYEETRVVNTEQPQVDEVEEGGEETDLLEQGGEESQRVVAVYPVYIPDIRQQSEISVSVSTLGKVIQLCDLIGMDEID